LNDLKDHIAAADDAMRVPGPLELGDELVDNISDLIDDGGRGMVLNLLADMFPADVARLLEHLTLARAQTLVRWMPTAMGGDVLPELEDDYRAALLEEIRTERITALLDEMDSDDAADVLADLPREVVQAVLPALEDKEGLEELLAYDEESAGGIMGREFVAVPGSWNVGQSTDEVRRKAEVVEPIYAVFVLDDAERLQGAVSLKRLLLSQSSALMRDIVDLQDLSVETSVDQEEVARIMERYDLVSLPVVDAGHRVVGRITIDDVVDVIREEAEEDIQLMIGVAGGEEHTDSILRISRGRLPWLVAGLFGAMLSAAVIASFEDALRQATVLAMFIPIVMATAGNAGIQSSAIAVQALASGDVWSSDILRRLMKELAVSVINAVVLAVVLALAVLLVPASDILQLAATAGLSLVVVVVLATTIGASVPLALDRTGIDPALATGPFIMVMNDILGILVFFLLATALYLS
jgi:magnesium transporter